MRVIKFFSNNFQMGNPLTGAQPGILSYFGYIQNYLKVIPRK